MKITFIPDFTNAKSGFIALACFLFFVFPAEAEEITIAAAANVQFVLKELNAVFERETGIQLKTVLGSSGKLTAQIEHGAPFDIFLSADMEYPEAVFKRGFSYGPPEIYAYGALVLMTFKKIDLSVGMKILADKSIKTIAIADPRTAPYGREAVSVLKYYNLLPNIEKKIIYGESISQVNHFLESQAAHIGLTAKAVCLAPAAAGKAQCRDIHPDAYNPIAQGVVILRHADERRLKTVRQFYDFLFSDQARAIFRNFGYAVR